MVNSTDLPPIPPDIISATAPLLIGTLFNWALFGILTVQTYVYYLNFQDDKLWQMLLVYGCYILEVVQTAMTAADLYFWFASGYGNVVHLGNVNISPVDTPILCGIIASVVQCFFAYRIYTIRRSYKWFCGLVILTSIIQFAGALGTGIRGIKLQEYDRFHEHRYFPQSFYVWLIGDAVCDIMIAGAMLWLFHQSRKDGIENGRRILGRLVRLIVETNTLTAGMATVSLVCYVALPNSNLFVCTTLIMGKLYSNTLLVTFNNRIAMRKINKDLSFETNDSSRTASGNRRIRITREFEVNTFCVASRGSHVGTESYEIETINPISESETLGQNKADAEEHRL